MLDKAAIAGFKDQLFALQRQLKDLIATGAEAASPVELDQTRVGRLSRMDALQGQAMARERQRRREVELEKIAAALARIDAREYGSCLTCGGDIAVKRLELDPANPLCIDCATKSEEKRR